MAKGHKAWAKEGTVQSAERGGSISESLDLDWMKERSEFWLWVRGERGGTVRAGIFGHRRTLPSQWREGKRRWGKGLFME